MTRSIVPTSSTSRLIKLVASPSSSSSVSTFPPSAAASSASARRTTAVQQARTIFSASPVQAQTDAREETADITIVGGGVAGLALACTLTAPSSPLAHTHTLTLIDAGNIVDKFVGSSTTDHAYPWPSSSTFENRTVSLSADNLAWLSSHRLDLFRNEAGQSSLNLDRMRNVHAMSVSDGLTGATIEFGDSDGGHRPGNPYLSTMVELSNLQHALLRTLYARAQNNTSGMIAILQGTKVENIVPSPSRPGQERQDPDPWPLLSLSSSSGTTELRTRLLIGADGHFSPVRTYAGIRTFGHDYHQRGLVGTLNCRPGSVGNTAFQRFLPTGPIAFLPMSDDVGSMVWTLPPDLARAFESVHKESNPELLAQLINAAFRLPWHSIDYLFSRIRSFSSESSQQARDWSWLSGAIEDRVRATLYRPAAEVEELGGVPDDEFSASVGMGSGGSSRAPPKVVSVEARSAASFPLKLRHAEAYTGASLRVGESAQSTLETFRPSRLLEGLMGSFGLLQGPVGEKGGPQAADRGFRDLTLPDADGHSSPPARSRTVLVGDAAHTIHPLAGQGLNQGLLDVRALASALEQGVLEEGADLGLAKSLGHVSGGYERKRWAANALWASGVDKLGGLFFGIGDGGRGYQAGGTDAAHNSRGGLASGLVDRIAIWARSTGLEILNELGPVKKRMSRGAGSPFPTAGPSPPFQSRN